VNDKISSKIPHIGKNPQVLWRPTMVSRCQL